MDFPSSNAGRTLKDALNQRPLHLPLGDTHVALYSHECKAETRGQSLLSARDMRRQI